MPREKLNVPRREQRPVAQVRMTRLTPEGVPHIVRLAQGPIWQTRNQDKVVDFVRVFEGARVAFDVNTLRVITKADEHLSSDELAHTVFQCNNFNTKCSPDETTNITVTVRDAEYGLVVPFNPGSRDRIVINRGFLYIEQPSHESIQASGQKAFTALADDAFGPETFAQRIWEGLPSFRMFTKPPPRKNVPMYVTYAQAGTVVLFASRPIATEVLKKDESRFYDISAMVATSCKVKRTDRRGVKLEGPGHVYHIAPETPN